jgi:hypothetical protein
MSVRILMQAADGAGGGVGAGGGGASGADGGEGAPSDDALVPPDQADIDEAEEGDKLEDDETPAGEPEPKKPAAETRPVGAGKKPDAKRQPPPPKKPAGEVEEPPAKETKAEDEEYEYEVPGDDGKPVKEKLTRAKVNELLARRRKLDSEAFARITEANKLSAPVRDLFKQIKQNPMAVFDLARLAGADPHQAAALYAQEWKRQQELTPEQRAFEEQTATLQRQKDDLDQKQADLDKAENDKKFHEKRTKVLKSVTGALDAAKMPKHPTVLQLVGDHLAAQVRGQAEDFEPDYSLAVDAAQDGLRDASRSWVGGLTYEQLIEEFPEVVKSIRAGDAARVKGAPVKGKQPPPPPPPREKKEETKFLSPQEWGEQMRGAK